MHEHQKQLEEIRALNHEIVVVVKSHIKGRPDLIGIIAEIHADMCHICITYETEIQIELEAAYEDIAKITVPAIVAVTEKGRYRALS